MNAQAKYTPGPWECRIVPCAGIEIFADVGKTLGKQFADLVMIYGLDACPAPRFLIAYERWVQFPKNDWDEMQQANAHLIAAAPELLEALTNILPFALEIVNESHPVVKAARAALAKAEGRS